MRAGLLVCVLAAPLLAQQVNVSGIAVDQAGSPLRGVHVRLVTGNFGESGGVEAVYGADSDSTGHFAMTGLKPGFYIVFGEHPGYLAIIAPGSAVPIPMVTLKAGQDVSDLKVTMTARAVIAGRVVDEYGDPVDRINVQTQPASGKEVEVLTSGNRNSATDDRGEFRLIVPPGKFYVMASPWNQQTQPGEIRTDGTSAASFVSTFYPSATASSSASVVEVGAGQDVAGIEIRLQRGAIRSQGRSLTVSGNVTGTPPGERATVMLRSGQSADRLYNQRSTSADPDGKFTVSGLEPAFYRVTAYYNSGKTTLQSRAVDFQLEASDVGGIQLSLAPGEDLSGTLVFTGDGTSSVEGRTVRLDPYGEAFRVGEPPSAKTAADGTFQMSNVMPGKYRVRVEPIPENGYLKEVVVDGKPLADDVLDFSQGVGRAKPKVTVSRNGGRISGKVVDKDGEPVLGMVEVILGTDLKNVSDQGSAKREVDGKYSFDAIRPGKYRLFAIDVLQMMGELQGSSDEALKPLFQAAEEIEIKDGDRLTKDVTAFTKLPEKK